MKLIFLCLLVSIVLHVSNLFSISKYFQFVIFFLQKSNGSKLLIETNSEPRTPFSLSPFLDDSVSCTVPGSYCSDDPADCDSIFLCLPGAENPLRSKCETGKSCNNGQCSTIPSAFCEYNNKEFQCRATGMFPEPSSCKEYNICCDSSSYSTKLGCENGYGYNVFTTFCDIPLQNNDCDLQQRIVPPCLNVGQNGALVSNPVLYYICLPYGNGDETLYPFLYKCPNGKLYVGDFICEQV